MSIKVVIAGARGRMGSAAVKAIQAAKDMEVIAVLDYKNEGMFLHNGNVTDESVGIPFYTSLTALAAVNHPDVLLDLTDPEAVYTNVHDALSLGIHPVVGTSGLSNERIAQLTEFAADVKIGGIIAPNFSIGAVLMMKFAVKAAPYLGDIEILEMHHDRKLDAPSGTAAKTADMIKEVRIAHKQGHPEEIEQQSGARGADVEGMKIHSIRLPGLLAHQEVLLGGEGELLTIRHDSFDRSCFMPGILMAIRAVLDKEELIYGLENIID